MREGALLLCKSHSAGARCIVIAESRRIAKLGSRIVQLLTMSMRLAPLPAAAERHTAAPHGRRGRLTSLSVRHRIELHGR